MYIRNAIGEGSWACSSWDYARADKHLNANRASVNLDTVQSSSSLGSLLVLVENDGCAANTTASSIILEENLLWSTYVDCRSKVILQGVLVVVLGFEFAKSEASSAASAASAVGSRRSHITRLGAPLRKWVS